MKKVLQPNKIIFLTFFICGFNIYHIIKNMLLFKNEIILSDISNPNIIIKVISWNNRKNITKIYGLTFYFNEKNIKKISRELSKICAAGSSVIDKKIIQIQGDNVDVIMDYLIKINIPIEKIKIRGI